MSNPGIPQPDDTPDVSQLPVESPASQYNLENANQAMTPPVAPPPTAQPGALKGLLTNFFGGMGRAMMVHAGLPTPEQAAMQQQNQAMKQQLDQSTIQYHQALAKNLADQNELVPIPQGPDADGNPQEPIYVARKSQATILAKQMQLKQQAQLQALNAELRARGIGGQIVAGPDGKPTFQPLATSQLTQPQQATITQKTQGPLNEAGLTIRSLRGDEEAKAALGEIQGRRLQLARERGAMLNQRPLYTLQKVIENGVPSFMTGIQILQAQQEGRNIQPSGALSAKDVLTVQRLQSESAPALSGVRSTLGTYDNDSDRAIYARVLSRAGTPGVGEESSWMGNVITQAMNSGLSDQGKQQAIALRRLADTMGTMRSLMGLQATDQAMALTLSLLPGPATPSAAYAKQQVDQLEGMIKAAVELPALGGARTPSGGGSKKATHKFNPATGKIEAY